jgi:hypothetical protein
MIHVKTTVTATSPIGDGLWQLWRTNTSSATCVLAASASGIYLGFDVKWLLCNDVNSLMGANRCRLEIHNLSRRRQPLIHMCSR